MNREQNEYEFIDALPAIDDIGAKLEELADEANSSEELADILQPILRQRNGKYGDRDMVGYIHQNHHRSNP